MMYLKQNAKLVNITKELYHYKTIGTDGKLQKMERGKREGKREIPVYAKIVSWKMMKIIF